MRVTRDLSSDRFNTGTTRMAPLFRSAQMVLRGTFVYGTLVNDGTPIGVYATSLKPYDLKSQKNIIDTDSDLLYLDKSLESMDSILKAVSNGDKRFEQTKMIGDKECYVFKPESFNITIGEQLAELVNLYTTDEVMETLNECYPEQKLIKKAFRLDIHFSGDWVIESLSNSYYRYIDCKVLSEAGFFLESVEDSMYNYKVQKSSSLDRYLDSSLGRNEAVLQYRGEKGLTDILFGKYSHKKSFEVDDAIFNVIKCVGVRTFNSLPAYRHIFKERFELKTLILTEIVPYISALRLYRDKEAFIRHCFRIIDRVYATRCESGSATIELMKEIITTMIENNAYLSRGGCSVILEEMKGKEIQPLELINSIPIPSE